VSDQQTTFTVAYDPGTQGRWIASNQTTQWLLNGVVTPEFRGTPTGNPGFVFVGWYPELAPTVSCQKQVGQILCRILTDCKEAMTTRTRSALGKADVAICQKTSKMFKLFIDSS